MERQRVARSLSSPRYRYLGGRHCDSVDLKKERRQEAKFCEQEKEKMLERQFNHVTLNSQVAFLANKISQANKILSSSSRDATFSGLKKRVPEAEEEIQAAIQNAKLVKEELSQKAAKYQQWRDQVLFQIAYGIFEHGRLFFPVGFICTKREKAFLVKVLQSLSPSLRLASSLKEKQFERLANIELNNNVSVEEKSVLQWILIHLVQFAEGKYQIPEKIAMARGIKLNKNDLSILAKESKAKLEQLEIQNLSRLNVSEEIKTLISKFLQLEIKKIHKAEIFQFFDHIYGPERGLSLILQHHHRRVIPTTIRTFLAGEIYTTAYKYLL